MGSVDKKNTTKPSIEFLLLGLVMIVACSIMLYIYKWYLMPRCFFTAILLVGIMMVLTYLTYSYTVSSDTIIVRELFKKTVIGVDEIQEVSIEKKYGVWIHVYYIIKINTKTDRTVIHSKLIDVSTLLGRFRDMDYAKWVGIPIIKGESCTLEDIDLLDFFSYRILQSKRILKPGLCVSLVITLICRFVNMEVAAWIYVAVWLFVVGAYVYFVDLYFIDPQIGKKTTNIWKLMGLKTDWIIIGLHISAFALLLIEMNRRTPELFPLEITDEEDEILFSIFFIVILGYIRYLTHNFLNDYRQILTSMPIIVLSSLLFYYYFPWLFAYRCEISAQLYLTEGSMIAGFSYHGIDYELPIRIIDLYSGKKVQLIIHEAPFNNIYAYTKGGFDWDGHTYIGGIFEMMFGIFD